MWVRDHTARRFLRTLQTGLPQMKGFRSQVERRAILAVRKPVEPEFRLLECLDPASEGVIVDVGANRGLTVASIRLFDDKHTIVAFEPNADITDWAAPGQTWHGPLVLHQCALGEKEGSTTLHTPVYARHRFDGLSSCDRHEAISWLGPETLMFFDPGKLQLSSQVRPIRTLDSFDLRPLVVKADVQGFEHQVLLGALRTIRRYRPLIIAEICQEGQASELLRENHYRPYRFSGGALRRDEFGAPNTVFMHEDETSRFARFMPTC